MCWLGMPLLPICLMSGCGVGGAQQGHRHHYRRRRFPGQDSMHLLEGLLDFLNGPAGIACIGLSLAGFHRD